MNRTLYRWRNEDLLGKGQAEMHNQPMEMGQESNREVQVPVPNSRSINENLLS